MVELVCKVAVALAVASFVVFVASAIWAAVVAYKLKDASAAAASAAKAGASRAAAAAPDLPQLTDLVKAVTGLIDSIVKAGPSLAGLVASIAFLAIAAWAASGGSGPAPKCSIAKGTVLADASGKAVDTIPVACEPAPAKK